MSGKSPFTRSQILSLCERGDFNSLIGTLEGFEFDCKMQPYVLIDDKGKRELAKDISAFANAGGGVILIGVKTEVSADHFGDEVVSINPVAQSLVNPTQYKDILATWIYPPVTGINVTWKATAADATKGVVVVDIPPQPPVAKPFLIAKTLDGSKVVESVFGYAMRKGDTSPPLGVKELQQHLNSGLTYDTNLDTRLAAIEAALEALVGNTNLKAQTQAMAAQLSGAVAAALEHADLKNRRILLLTAQPTTQSRLQTVFASTPGSLKSTVERPPTLRHNGWSVETADTAKIVQGKFIRATNGPRKVLDLYADGTMVFAASAENDFLAWGKRSPFNINPLALVEVVYSFMALYTKVLGDFAASPVDIQLGVGIRHAHLNGDPSVLGPGELNSLMQQFSDNVLAAPADKFDETYCEPAATFDVEIAAYEIVRLVYLWFGLDENSIPYAYDKSGRRAVNSAKIAQT